MSISRFTGLQGVAVALGALGALLLIGALMVLVDVLPQRPASGASEVAHWRSELAVTFAVVFVPGIAAIVAASVLWLRSRRSHRKEHTNAAYNQSRGCVKSAGAKIGNDQI